MAMGSSKPNTMGNKSATAKKEVYVGTLNDLEVWIHIRSNELVGASLVNRLFGVSVECDVMPGTTNEQRVQGLLKGLKSAAKEEQYELACIVRDTLKALGLNPLTIEG
jgi:excinuclease UvrABC helicase subunit UvrB